MPVPSAEGAGIDGVYPRTILFVLCRAHTMDDGPVQQGADMSSFAIRDSSGEM